eukprot:scaffold996_cov409-Prasinococcus_capsulatus_cf.AAC.29
MVIGGHHDRKRSTRQAAVSHPQGALLTRKGAALSVRFSETYTVHGLHSLVALVAYEIRHLYNDQQSKMSTLPELRPSLVATTV